MILFISKSINIILRIGYHDIVIKCLSLALIATVSAFVTNFITLAKKAIKISLQD